MNPELEIDETVYQLRIKNDYLIIWLDKTNQTVFQYHKVMGVIINNLSHTTELVKHYPHTLGALISLEHFKTILPVCQLCNLVEDRTVGRIVTEKENLVLCNRCLYLVYKKDYYSKERLIEMFKSKVPNLELIGRINDHLPEGSYQRALDLKLITEEEL